MKMIVEFDCDADIIDVPQEIIDKKDILRKRFLSWLYDKGTKHKYWVKIPTGNGKWFLGVQYRSEAFVEWLNKKVLRTSEQKAVVVRQNVAIEMCPSDLPSIFF